MQCKNCGTINEGNSKFCKKCGAQLEKGANDSSNIEKVKSKGKKKQGIFGKIVVIAIAVVLILFLRMMLKGDKAKFDSVENTIYQYLDEEQQETYFVNAADKQIIGSFAHEEMWNTNIMADVSLDGTTRVILFNEHTLILVKETGITEVSEDVYGYVLSVNGNKLAYVEGKGTLYLYDCENMTTEKIANIVDEDSIRISPNGESLAYVDQEEESKLCVYSNDKVFEIGEDLLPIGLPDSAKYVYCYNTQNEGIYVKYLDGESKKLGTNSGMLFYFNNNHTQLQFFVDDSCYVSEEGNDKIKLFDECGAGWIVDGYYIVDNRTASASFLGVVTYSLKNINNSYYISHSNENNSTVYDLYYVDKKWNSELIEKNVFDSSYVATDKSGKDLCYIKNNKLYKIEDGKYKNPFFVADNVTRFVMTSDGEAIYYIDNEDTLWYKKGRKEEKKIAEEVNADNLYITHDDYVLFLTDYSNESGTLYSCYRGKEKKRIADDVSEVSINNRFAEYKTNYDYDIGTYDVYGANKKDDFSLILENVY